MAKIETNVVIFLPYSSAVRSSAVYTHLCVCIVLSGTYTLIHMYGNYVSLSTTKVIFPIEESITFIATVCVQISCQPVSSS